MFVACCMANRIAVCKVAAQSGQRGVLGRLESASLQTFQLNAYRVVVALCASPVKRGASMPGALVTIDKLPQAAVALQQKMR